MHIPKTIANNMFTKKDSLSDINRYITPTIHNSNTGFKEEQNTFNTDTTETSMCLHSTVIFIRIAMVFAMTTLYATPTMPYNEPI